MTLAAGLGLLVLAFILWPPRPGEAPRVRVEDGDSADGGSIGPEARRPAPSLDEAADALVLCALAMRSGLGPVEALEAVARHVPASVGHDLRVVASAHRWGQDSRTAWSHVGGGWEAASFAWQAAERSGAAPAGVVLAAAERMRGQETARVEAAVQRAGVLLVLPLGACFLPGFVGTTVVPVVLHLAKASLGG
ncbi:type II secretion system F family protein [Rothia sp. ARF10]|nr:type II secretion system F family protein [Rothia sp. ARF10]